MEKERKQVADLIHGQVIENLDDIINNDFVKIFNSSDLREAYERLLNLKWKLIKIRNSMRVE